MSDRGRPAERGQPTGEPGIGRLLGLAGRRPSLPAERAARIRTAFAEPLATEVRRRRATRRARRWLMAAACVGGIVAAVWAAERWRATAPAPSAVVVRALGGVHLVKPGRAKVRALVAGDAIAVGAAVETAQGGGAGLALGEAQLRLDGATRLRLASAHLLELERGAVYVDSPGVGSRALVVRTPLGEVREIGTRFEVRLAGGALRVRVREGRTLVDDGRRRLMAAAAEEIELAVDGAVVRRAIAPHHPDWAWTGDLARPRSIDGMRLPEYLDWLGRESGWAVRFASPEVERGSATVVIHGGPEVSSPERALPLVMSASELGYCVADGILWVGAGVAESGDQTPALCSQKRRPR